MSGHIHIAGRYYRPFHRSWGSFAEELFHHTSRYYAVTESFLRNLSGCARFAMGGYQAEKLSEPQRHAMAGVLGYAPGRDTGLALISIVEAVMRGESAVDARLAECFPPMEIEDVPAEGRGACVPEPAPSCVGPLEPWLSLAERLHMAVAVREHHVELDMRVLATHLDSPNPTIRANLQKGILELHQAGYLLRNHPHLTHAEANEIADEGAV
jgi:hypothetical protein